jgi:hypothetical protein
VGRVSGIETPQARLRALAATATIGTDRFGGDATAVDTLLTEAAACGLRARAGWRPREHAGSLTPCPADERPVAPAPAIGRLRMLLAERDAGLIEEWATLAVSHAVRVDGASAPILLDWWTGQPKRPAAVFAALGQQGDWLASLNPDWAHRAPRTGVPPDAESRWQLGSNAERITLLTSLRRLDPARALALVASTWETDAAPERQKFLEVLREHASMADEPFLEAALDDRSKIVRRHAATVLLRVPGSRWRQRMTAAARQFISVQSSGLIRKKTAITLSPPEAFDPAWERDGIEPQPPKGIGPRAWWLRLILTAADLALWTELTGLPPAGVLEALQGDDFAGDAVAALVDAARLAEDPDWCAALARHLLRQSPVQIDVIGALLQALGEAEAERLTLEIAAVDSLGTIERWVAIAAIDRPWSFELSRDLMTMMSNHTPNLTGGDAWRASQLAEIVSRRVDPRVADVFERAVTRSFSLLKQDTIDRHVDRVRVRAEMRKEFVS